MSLSRQLCCSHLPSSSSQARPESHPRCWYSAAPFRIRQTRPWCDPFLDLSQLLKASKAGFSVHRRQSFSRISHLKSAEARIGSAPIFDPSRLHVIKRPESSSSSYSRRLMTSSSPVESVAPLSAQIALQQQSQPSCMRSLAPVHFHASDVESSMGALGPFPSLIPRFYTITHSDISGDIFLAIDSEINESQLQSASTRFFRDEVIVEWRRSSTEAQTSFSAYSLHVHCHVSGGHPFLAPGHLRNWIFQQEMPLVLQCICHAERHLFTAHPELQSSPVWVHFHSTDPALHRADCWGPLAAASQKTTSTPLSHVIMMMLSQWTQEAVADVARRLSLEPYQQTQQPAAEPLVQPRATFLSLQWQTPPLIMALMFGIVVWLDSLILDIPWGFLDWYLLL